MPFTIVCRITERTFNNFTKQWTDDYEIDGERLQGLKNSPGLRMETEADGKVTTLKFYNRYFGPEFLDVVVTITK